MKHTLHTITLALFFLHHPSSHASNGLVGHWKLDGDAKDFSGNNNHGYIHGAVPSTDRNGDSNGSLFFDGKDDFVEIQHTRLLNPPLLTYSIWVKHEERLKNNNEYIVISRNDKGGESGYHLRIGGPKEDTHWNTYIGNRGGDLTRNRFLQWPGFRAKSKVIPKKWYHVCVTVSLNQLNLFINGKEESQMGLKHMLVPNTKRPLYLGGDPVHMLRSDVGNCVFFGHLDDFRIYERALSITEVQALYNLGQ